MLDTNRLYFEFEYVKCMPPQKVVNSPTQMNLNFGTEECLGLNLSPLGTSELTLQQLSFSSEL